MSPISATCGECEFFGDFDKMLYAEEWSEEKTAGGLTLCYHKFISFDERAGAICALPRSGTKTRSYLAAPACPHFKPRTWTRPENCDNCDRCHGRMSDGSYLCDGWPFYKKEGREPCQNGRAAYGQNLRLF